MAIVNACPLPMQCIMNFTQTARKNYIQLPVLNMLRSGFLLTMLAIDSLTGVSIPCTRCTTPFVARLSLDTIGRQLAVNN